MGMFGAISNYKPTIEDRLAWGTQDILQRMGMNQRTANSYGQKVRAAVGWLPYVGDAIGMEQGLRDARGSAQRGDVLGRLMGSTQFALAALPIPGAIDKMASSTIRRARNMNEFDKFLGHIRRTGLPIETNGSNLSKSKYVNIGIPNGVDDEGQKIFDTVKVRISDHELPPSYGNLNGWADYEIGPHQSAASHYLDVVSSIYKRAGIEPAGPTKSALTKLAAQRAIQEQRRAAEVAAFNIKKDAQRAQGIKEWDAIRAEFGLPASIDIPEDITNPATMRKRVKKWLDGDIYALGFNASRLHKDWGK